MDTIQLVTPSAEYARQIADFRRELLESGSTMDGCGPLERFADPLEYLAEVEKYTKPETLPPGKVQATQLLAVREGDGRLVGMIQVRHTLNDHLRKFGGHIGYCVRPSERRKGYATEQLRLVLPYCKELGLDKVLITCHADNEGSRRTILKNGGVYERTNCDDTRGGRPLELYWVKT